MGVLWYCTAWGRFWGFGFGDLWESRGALGFSGRFEA